MQRCNDMILACKWQGQTVPCTELFQVRRTDNGFCCSFNTINIDEQLQVQSIFLDFCKTHIIIFNQSSVPNWRSPARMTRATSTEMVPQTITTTTMTATLVKQTISILKTMGTTLIILVKFQLNLVRWDKFLISLHFRLWHI